MSFAAVMLAILLAYLSCAFFVHAEPRRAAVAVRSGNASGDREKQYRITGWVLLVASLIVSCYPQGAERGITIWIGLMGAAGGLSLLAFALIPKWHFVSAIGLAGLGLVLSLGFALMGAS